MSDICRPFSSVRSNKVRHLVHCLSIHFRFLIRKSGLTLHSLDFRVRRFEDLRLTRSVKKREKERSGHGYKPPLRPRHPMGLDLVLVEDPDNLHSNAEIAEAVVQDHWNMGEFKRQEKERMSDVVKLLMTRKMTRSRGLGMRATLARLVREKQTKTSVWIPSRLSDCYDLSHDTVVFDNSDLSFYWEECVVCERVREFRRKQQKLEITAESLEFKERFEAMKGG